MKTKKVKMECGFDELCLIERALELYSRVGILQFEYLTGCASLQQLIWEERVSGEFRKKADELKAIFGYPANANPGIFNTDHVRDDVRTAAHLYQLFRHERYKDRLISGEQTERHYTVDEHPADICDIAGQLAPIMTVQIEQNENSSSK